MKKIILTNGIIAGLIVSITLLLSMNYMSHCKGNINFTTSMLIGFGSMILSFLLVFVGIKNYRDKINGGSITFGNALKIGFLIVLIASTMYVASWLVYYFNFDTGFMDTYTEHSINELKASGKSAEEIQIKINEMLEFKVKYNNPVYNGLVTYSEILPVGLLINLISSFILKRKTAK